MHNNELFYSLLYASSEAVYHNRHKRLYMRNGTSLFYFSENLTVF